MTTDSTKLKEIAEQVAAVRALVDTLDSNLRLLLGHQLNKHSTAELYQNAKSTDQLVREIHKAVLPEVPGDIRPR